MSPLGVEANRQIELGSRLTADESQWCGTPGSSWPSRAGLKARRSDRPALSVDDLVGGSAGKPGMRPVSVVPGEVERQFLVEGGE